MDLKAQSFQASRQIALVGTDLLWTLIWSSLRVLLLVSLSVSLGACMSQDIVEPEQAEEVTKEAVAETKEALRARPIKRVEYPVASFDKETLYQLLVAEIAGHRNQLDVALDNYYQVTKQTRDPGIAARATRLAVYLRREVGGAGGERGRVRYIELGQIALETAKIWASADPENIEAQRYAADQLMRAGDLGGAVVFMEAVKRLGGMANFDMVAYRAANLDAPSRESLLATIEAMLERYPDDTQLLFSKAVLLEQNGNPEDAVAITETLLETKKGVNVIVLHVNVLKKLGRSEQAIDFLGKEVEAEPGHRRLRLFYAQLLFEEKELDGAREEYEMILARSPGDANVLFALGLIAMEQDRDEAAIGHLSEMVRLKGRAGEAHYYLGSIAEKQDRIAEAIREYRRAGNGYEFLPAQGRIADLMAEQGDLSGARRYLENVRGANPERAVQLILVEAQLLTQHEETDAMFAFLDEAIERDPDNVDLLYYRAMAGERHGDIGILERDLRRVISIDPENADALNALGYTLTDKTNRHQEALKLITKALQIKPNEAAFIDSIGWVHFRLADYEKALAYLRKALDMFPNDEVAAHLGEVLWAVGEKAEANIIWNKGLEIAPGSVIIKDVIERLTQ